MSDYQAAWQQTIAAYRAINPAHPAQRAKFKGFTGGTLVLEVSEYVAAALGDKQQSIKAEFAKYAGSECHTLTLTNRDGVAAVVDNPSPAESEIDRLRRELAEAHQQISSLQQEVAELKHEATYQREWGGLWVADQDTVTISRETLKQVALICLDTKTPRTAAPLFLYILSEADTTGLAALEASAVSRDLLKLENRRSWGNLLGPIFGTWVNRDGHSLRLNVTTSHYQSSQSNHLPLQGTQPATPESNHTPLQGEKLSPQAVTMPENVTSGSYNSDVMNDDDINKKSNPLEGYHQSTPLPLETKRRLDQRQRQLHAMNFNRDVAAKFEWAITYAPDETWASWLEQAGRGKTPAALMCDKIKAYDDQRRPKVLDLRNRKMG